MLVNKARLVRRAGVGSLSRLPVVAAFQPPVRKRVRRLESLPNRQTGMSALLLRAGVGSLSTLPVVAAFQPPVRKRVRRLESLPNRQTGMSALLLRAGVGQPFQAAGRGGFPAAGRQESGETGKSPQPADKNVCPTGGISDALHSLASSMIVSFGGFQYADEIELIEPPEHKQGREY
jgi:hypothetical protein